MRVPSQLSVSTTAQTSEHLGYKTILLKAGSTAILVAFSHKLHRAKDTDWFSIGANEHWKVQAPKGKLIHYVFYKTASGTSTLDLVAYDGDIEKIA